MNDSIKKAYEIMSRNNELYANLYDKMLAQSAKLEKKQKKQVPEKASKEIKK